MDLWQTKTPVEIMGDLKRAISLMSQNKTCLHDSWLLLGSRKQLDEDQTVSIRCVQCGSVVFANSYAIKGYIK